MLLHLPDRVVMSWNPQTLQFFPVMVRDPNWGRGSVNLQPFSYPVHPMNLLPEVRLRIIVSFELHEGHG